MKYSVTVMRSIKSDASHESDAAVMQEEVMINEGIDIRRFSGIR